MDNRFYLQALGVTGLFVCLLLLIWNASGGRASEAAVENANSTRTAIAMTGSYLMQPSTETPVPFTGIATSLADTSVPGSTPTFSSAPSATNTSFFPWFSTPMSRVAPSLTALPSQTAIAQIPNLTITVPPGHPNTKAPPIAPQSGTPTGIATTGQDPTAFAHWYFTRVWNERDYQNLWDNYLTASYKAHVGSGLFDDYVWWWNSVQRVDVNSVEVLENNGSNARARVNLTFYMTDGRVIQNQVYEYGFLYDPSRATWMFDVSG